MARTSLGFERGGMGGASSSVAGGVRREQLIDHVRANGAIDDPVVRQRLARAAQRAWRWPAGPAPRTEPG